MTPVVNARMYSATPAVKAAWQRVLAWVLARAGLEWTVIDHDPPAPLAALWAREDLGSAMMCGLPWSQRNPRPTLVVAPVPSPERYAGEPVYYTDIAVRADSPYRSLEDTFGGTIGFTLEDSMSGCVALRRHLLAYRRPDTPSLYRASVGGLLNARAVIEALDAGRIDVGPLDSWYHDLLKMNDPDFAARVRTVATTEAAPIPPIIATTALEPGVLERLRAAFFAVGDDPALAEERDTLLLARFTLPATTDYDAFEAILAASRQYPSIW